MPTPPPSGPSFEGPELRVTYFTDPLCVWSWAFEPVWRRLLRAYEGRIRWRYAMGGMIPSWRDYHDTLNDVDRPFHMGALCRRASEIGGVAIADRIWAEGRNVARREVLLDLASELAADRPQALSAARFEHDLGGSAAREAFRADLTAARDAGIGRFPTLTLQAPGGDPRMIVGYRPYDALLVALAHVAPSLATTPS